MGSNVERAGAGAFALTLVLALVLALGWGGAALGAATLGGWFGGAVSDGRAIVSAFECVSLVPVQAAATSTSTTWDVSDWRSKLKEMLLFDAGMLLRAA